MALRENFLFSNDFQRKIGILWSIFHSMGSFCKKQKRAIRVLFLDEFTLKKWAKRHIWLLGERFFRFTVKSPFQDQLAHQNFFGRFHDGRPSSNIS